MRDNGSGHRGALIPQDQAAAAVTRRGQAAALALARRLGLPVDAPAVLSSRGNLVLHLAPAPVVARVATLSAWSRADPLSWLAREVEVARYVAGAGGPVVPPASAVDPGPYWQDGFAVSLWEHVQLLELQPGPADVGFALARLHQAARACPAPLGDMSPAGELITDGLDALERESAVDAATASALRSAHADVLSGLAGAHADRIVLHGDAHGGNLLADSRGGWVWIDLEETCRGPAAWDLATLVERYDDEAARLLALRAYAAETGTDVPDATELAPFRRARKLEAAVWSLCMAQLYPARYADAASHLLTDVLGS
jgi:hypothetical protein